MDVAIWPTAMIRTLPRIQVVVVDDCSPHDVRSRVEALVEKYAWAKIVVAPLNSGPATARNLGAAHADSEWLWFLDSDVSLQPGALGEMAEICRELRGFSAVVNGVGPKPSPASSPFQKVKNYLEHSWQPKEGPTFSVDSKSFTVRADVYRRLGGFNEAFRAPTVEDYDFCYRLLSAGEKPLFTHRVKIFHRHPKMLSQMRLFFHRAREWMQLKAKYGYGFDDYGTSSRESLVQIVNLLILLVTALVIALPRFWPLLVSMIGLWIWMKRKELAILRANREPLLFYVYYFFCTCCLSIPVVLGAMLGLADNLQVRRSL